MCLGIRYMQVFFLYGGLKKVYLKQSEHTYHQPAKDAPEESEWNADSEGDNLKVTEFSTVRKYQNNEARLWTGGINHVRT